MIMSCWKIYGFRVRLGFFSLIMRILITGASGLIGGRLAEYLSRAGHQLTLVSRNSMQLPACLSSAKVDRIDWYDELSLRRSCDSVDAIIHAAGMNSRESSKDPVGALAFNGLATARLASIANLAGVEKFIYISTAHVYKSPLVGYFSEDSCVRNLHPYASSHHAGEQYLLGNNVDRNIQTIVLRLSNAFGAPIDKRVNCWGLLANDLCRQAVLNGQLELSSSGIQERDFINISLVCKVVEYLLVQELHDASSQVFNVGSGVSRSVRMMAELIQSRCIRLLKYKPNLVSPGDAAEEDYGHLNYSVEKIMSLGIGISDLEFINEIDNLILFCKKYF